MFEFIRLNLVRRTRRGVALRKSPCGPLWRGGCVRCCAGRGPENLTDPPLPPTPPCPRPSGRGVFPNGHGGRRARLPRSCPWGSSGPVAVPPAAAGPEASCTCSSPGAMLLGRPPAPCNDFLFVVGGRRAWGFKGVLLPRGGARARAALLLDLLKGLFRGLRP